MQGNAATLAALAGLLAIAVYLVVPPLAFYLQQYNRRVEALILSLRQKRKAWTVMVEQTILFVILFTMGFVVKDVAIGLIFGMVGLVIPFISLRAAFARRQKLLDSQFIDTLMVLSTCLRAGLNLRESVEIVSTRAGAPTRDEFQMLSDDLKLGMQVETAIQRLAGRISLPCYDTFANAIIVTRQAGGDLAHILDRLAESHREVSRLEGMIEALTAQGRMQGNLLALLPIALGTFIYILEADMITPLFQPIWGYVLLTGIIFCELTGLYLIRRVMRIEI
jgi:tight adherence protein B